jgi:ubiquinone/menaquinone biosynthesis C-methylase UbiE
VETSPRVVQQFFEAQATYWHDVYGGADVFSNVVRRREAIALAWIKGLGLAPQTRVLEVGCGAGGLAVKLAQMGMSVQALDTVPAMVALTRSQSVVAGVEGQLRASEGDVHSLSFRDASYQLVTALGVLPWLHSPARAMQEMGRVLAPGGFMVFSADNWTGLDQLIDPFRNAYLAPLKRAAKRALVRVGAKRDEPFAQPEVLRRGDVERILGDAGSTAPHADSDPSRCSNSKSCPTALASPSTGAYNEWSTEVYRCFGPPATTTWCSPRSCLS